VQQTRDLDVEKAVEVVRNHEGGTRVACGSVAPKGASAPGSGHIGGMPAGGRHSNPKRGGIAERGFQRSRERSEGEAKIMKAVGRSFGCWRR
jgi:hypothetical protein